MDDGMKPISLGVSAADYAVFQRAAAQQGRSVAQLIREAMAAYRVERLDMRAPLRVLPRLVGHKPKGRLPSRRAVYDEIFDEAGRS